VRPHPASRPISNNLPVSTFSNRKPAPAPAAAAATAPPRPPLRPPATGPPRPDTNGPVGAAQTAADAEGAPPQKTRPRPETTLGTHPQ
jgi:hypothetical protein